MSKYEISKRLVLKTKSNRSHTNFLVENIKLLVLPKYIYNGVLYKL